jgi:hypothetical protein
MKHILYFFGFGLATQQPASEMQQVTGIFFINNPRHKTTRRISTYSMSHVPFFITCFARRMIRYALFASLLSC